MAIFQKINNGCQKYLCAIFWLSFNRLRRQFKETICPLVFILILEFLRPEIFQVDLLPIFSIRSRIERILPHLILKFHLGMLQKDTS